MTIQEKITCVKKRNSPICIWGCGQTGTKVGYDLVQKIGLNIDFFCDSNPALQGKEIVDGIICDRPSRIIIEKAFVLVMVTEIFEDDVLNTLIDMGVNKDSVVTCTELVTHYIDLILPFINTDRIAVYTCITNGYDILKEPQINDSRVDFYYISDKELPYTSKFQFIDINTVVPEYITEETRRTRFCKINAHIIFPKYRYSLFFDGSIRIKSDIMGFFDHMPPARIILLNKVKWDSPYVEAARRCITQRDKKEIILEQVYKYKLEGLPDDVGVYTTGILIREHNHYICRKLMDDWWEQLMIYSKRDQISFPYVLWKNGFGKDDVDVVIKEEIRKECKFFDYEPLHAIPRKRE